MCIRGKVFSILFLIFIILPSSSIANSNNDFIFCVEDTEGCKYYVDTETILYTPETKMSTFWVKKTVSENWRKNSIEKLLIISPRAGEETSYKEELKELVEVSYYIYQIRFNFSSGVYSRGYELSYSSQNERIHWSPFMNAEEKIRGDSVLIDLIKYVSGFINEHKETVRNKKEHKIIEVERADKIFYDEYYIDTGSINVVNNILYYSIKQVFSDEHKQFAKKSNIYEIKNSYDIFCCQVDLSKQIWREVSRVSYNTDGTILVSMDKQNSSWYSFSEIGSLNHRILQHILALCRIEIYIKEE